MRRTFTVLSLLIVLTMVLTACSTPAVETPAAPAATEVPAATALPAADMPQGCLGTAENALVDLNCRAVTIAVENAYLPFNYISIETGEPGGWDYEALDEICTRLHCEPVYVEAGWDGMI